ncbi:GntR family transcriptional regulator [Actinomadura sp. GTD37]|uniref:GntR family transcriptional regulator n=1 Tax=Actinomadura sp. GTD37 TaxID=1778030 RepID=UPI0035C160C4
MARRTAWGAYIHITDALRQRLTDGTYPPGTLVPPERALCAEFGVTRNTVRRALTTLQREGLIRVRSGVGRFVCDPTIEPAAQARPRYLAIAADLRRQIKAGHFASGDLLPSEARICERYHVSRFTARHAYEALETAGLVTSAQGKGRFVRQDVPR